jgi:hypothetical protein
MPSVFCQALPASRPAIWLTKPKRRRWLAMLGLPLILATSISTSWTPVLDARAAAKPNCGSGSTWDVKVGSDPQAGQVDQTSAPTPITVAQLNGLRLPSPINHRVQPTETTVFVTTARINDISVEHDADTHLAIDDGTADAATKPGHFMIAELPDIRCVPRTSAFYSGIQRAHSQLSAWGGTIPVTARITGVGFFDSYTDQSDQAPNQIELHSVLNLNINPGSITGQVTSSTGDPISGASASDGVDPAVITGSNGVYTIPYVAAKASYTVTASASGFSGQSKSVAVSYGSPSTANYSLPPSPTSGAVTGAVTSASGGSAIAGAVVSDSGGASATTNSSGAYTLIGLAPGSHTLTASSADFASGTQTASVTSGQTTTGVNFSLTTASSTGAVSGTVTSASGGAVIPGAIVSDSGGASTSTDASGAYTMIGLAPGSHSLTASSAGFTSGTQTASIVAGTTTQNFNFSITPKMTGAPQLVQAAGAHASSASTTLTDTFSLPTSAGNLLVLSASVYTGTSNPISSVTDSTGNTWTRIGAFVMAGHNSDGEMWYSANARAVTRVAVHTTNPAIVSMEVQEFSGVATTSPLDVSAGTSNTSASASSGSVAPTAATDLVVGFVAGHSSAQAISVTAPGYTAQGQQTSNGGGSAIASVVTGYRVMTSASSQGFTGSFSSAMYWAAGIVAFKVGT